MVILGEKSFCVGISHKPVVTVQRAFRAKYAKDTPTDKTIRAWYKQFTETRCRCQQKSSVRPLTAEDDKWFRASFLHSPKKPMATAAKELSMSKTNVEVLLSVWFLNHTTSKWYNCRMKITGASFISVNSYKT
jgi:hypothetical protein